MVVARLLCSDEGCASVYHAYGPLEEIEALACECGCGLVLLGWPEPVDGGAREPESILLIPG